MARHRRGQAIRYFGPRGGYGSEKTVKQYITPLPEPQKPLRLSDCEYYELCKRDNITPNAIYLYGRIRATEMFEEKCRNCPERQRPSFALEKF